MTTFLEKLAFKIISTLLSALIVFLIWNPMISNIFDLRSVNYWESILLVLISAELLKGTQYPPQDTNKK